MTADQVRAAMSEDMRQVCDAMRSAFGAKLMYIETASFKAGRDPYPDPEAAKHACEEHAGKAA